MPIHLPGKITRLISNLKLTPWLASAAILHVATTFAVFLVGHFRLFPNTFDENGIGISFAIDGTSYRKVVLDMVDALNRDGFFSWPSIHGPFHCRLYALPFYFLGRLVGYNIITAEPLNLFYYLGILVFVYLLGREVFNARTGLLAAIIIGLWPSFILHSTQLLRDSLSTVLLLALILGLAVLLKREVSYLRALWIAIVSLALIILFWLVRGNMWNVVIAAMGITAVLLAIRMILERKLLLTNALLLIVIFIGALFVPSRIESTSLHGTKPPTAILAIPSGSTPSKNSIWTRLLTQVRARREGFRGYTSTSSNIDENVKFTGATDLLRYLPRATEIGFLAPFPRMWFESGSGGKGGRLLAGFETLLMYFLYVPVVICAWKDKRNLGMWLLLVLASLSLISLGLIVVNVGALYRLRYAFWMMLVLVAAAGSRNISHWTFSMSNDQ